jgi:hypothetical protein
LRRLDWALHAFPTKDRDDIVRETRSHIEERINQNMAESQILASLGDADDYAQSFLDEFELSQALGSRKLPAMIGAAARWIHRRVAAAAAFTSVLLLGLFATGVIPERSNVLPPRPRVHTRQFSTDYFSAHASRLLRTRSARSTHKCRWPASRITEATSARQYAMHAAASR